MTELYIDSDIFILARKSVSPYRQCSQKHKTFCWHILVWYQNKDYLFTPGDWITLANRSVCLLNASIISPSFPGRHADVTCHTVLSTRGSCIGPDESIPTHVHSSSMCLETTQMPFTTHYFTFITGSFTSVMQFNSTFWLIVDSLWCPHSQQPVFAVGITGMAASAVKSYVQVQYSFVHLFVHITFKCSTIFVHIQFKCSTIFCASFLLACVMYWLI